jgi:hypothetical protein
VTLTISGELIDPRTAMVDLVAREPSSGSSIDTACSSDAVDPVDPVLTRFDPVFDDHTVRLLRSCFPSLRVNSALEAMPSSIPHTRLASCSPGFARSEADTMILLPALRTYSPTDVWMRVSHTIAYTLLYI